MKTNIVEITVRNQTIIRSRPLYQWDSGQILRVVDQDIPDGTEIQFGNSFMREAIPAFFSDNQVKIPQAAMEQPMEIKAYMMIVSEDNETTTKLVRIPIIPKPKPCEYVPEEEEASILQIIQSKVDKSGWTPDMYLGTDENGNVVEVKGGGGAVITVNTGASAPYNEPSMTFEEAISVIESGQSLMLYNVSTGRAHTLQCWDSEKIVFTCRVMQYVMAETGTHEKFTYHKDNLLEYEYFTDESISYGILSVNEDGFMVCDKTFMTLFWDDLNLGKAIGLMKQSDTEMIVYYFYKLVPNDSTGGVMAVFGTPEGEFIGLGFDDSVIELPSQSPSGGGVSFITDETLTLENGILSVNTADAAEADNTLPITSAAVATEIGNIDALLKTI